MLSGLTPSTSFPSQFFSTLSLFFSLLYSSPISIRPSVINQQNYRDHIKRVHSARYGCHRCKERYQCRDNTLAETDKKHKKSCKYANKEPLRLNDYKPEWMTPEEDKRYFAIDFRKKDTKSPPTLEDQYLRICVAIWPNFDSQNINICKPPFRCFAAFLSPFVLPFPLSCFFYPPMAN